MTVDILHTLVAIAGFVCIGAAIVVLVLFALLARDAGDRGRAGCLGGLLTVALIGLASMFFYVASLT